MTDKPRETAVPDEQNPGESRPKRDLVYRKSVDKQFIILADQLDALKEQLQVLKEEMKILRREETVRKIQLERAKREQRNIIRALDLEESAKE